MKYKVIELPYKYNQLAPYLDEITVKTHYEKHHFAYAEKLEAALQTMPEFRPPSTVRELLGNLSDVPERIRMAVRNNGGGLFNHNFYWLSLSPKHTAIPEDLDIKIKASFGDLESFKTLFEASALSLFGSGWTWLCLNKGGLLEIVNTQNQDSVITRNFYDDLTPLLCVDVWEHAYYLEYQNRRADYLKAFWNIIDWQRVSARMQMPVAAD